MWITRASYRVVESGGLLKYVLATNGTVVGLGRKSFSNI